MKIKLHEITVREVAKGYVDSAEQGVVGYGGRLNIRPAYQREFVYKDKQRDAVIETIRKDFPLNVIYWMINDEGTYEMLDGQQRTISFCQYINNDFSIDNLFFHNLTKPDQDKILDYKLMIYFCEGNDREKLDWFQIINIAGEKLTDQEMRNAIYTGPWLSDAKLKFSKTNCMAYKIANKYLNGIPIRQDYLETALDWLSGDKIRDYMSKHQHDPNANELWLFFQNVIHWVEATFKVYRQEMKGLDWGRLYKAFGDKVIDTVKLETEIAKLMMDRDVTKKAGIYDYVLTRDERSLNIRAFEDDMKREAYERQKSICPDCKKQYSFEEMDGHHFKPWSEGGKTIAENCIMLCKTDNRKRGNK
jgi:hypothetical protein